MKKHFTLHSIGWTIVLFEIILCVVFTLSVFLVNGTDTISQDHISLFLLVAITMASLILMKSGKNFLNKAVLAMGIVPLLFIGYEVMLTFLLPSHAQSGVPPVRQFASILIF